MTPGALTAIRTAAGPGGWTDDPDRLAPHLVEWRGRWPGQTPLMVQPDTVAGVQAVMRACHAHGVAVTPQGGNTGLVGAQIPQGEILLSLRRLDRIRSCTPLDDVIVVEAGVTLQRVQEAARDAGRRFPLSLASEGSASIGGLIATNAGGVHVRRHGMMRQSVMGLEAVLADGTLLEGLSSLRKDNTGYDLKHLLIGSEGTLGIVTAASLKMVAAPGQTLVAMLALERPDAAIALLHDLEARTGAVAAFELMNETGVAFALRHIPAVRAPFDAPAPWLALVEFEGGGADFADRCLEALEAGLAAGLARDVVLASSETQARAFWLLREEMSAAQKPEGLAAKHDVSVPLSQVPRFLDEAGRAALALAPGARIVAFGHASDGNIHYDVVQPQGVDPGMFEPLIAPVTEAVHDIVCALGGSISAEHGIGVARRGEFVRREPEASLHLMRALKAAFDPKGLLNPRVML